MGWGNKFGTNVTVSKVSKYTCNAYHTEDAYNPTTSAERKEQTTSV